MSQANGFDQIREANLPQGPIRYRDVGSGPPIVFVHGLLVNGLLWRNVVPHLSGEFRCIVPDWPLGSHPVAMDRDADLSPAGLATIVGDFMAQLDLDDATLAGNDSGGAIAQILISRRPERVGRLALLSCDAFEVFPPRLFAYLQLSARVPGLLRLASESLRLRALRRAPIAYGWATKRPIPHEITDAYVEPALRDPGVRRDVRKFLRAVSPSYTLDAAARFPEFRRPVLVGWAAEDRFFPWELAERLAAAFPDSRLERIPDSRTFVPEDQPRRTADLIRSLARETAAVAA